MDRSALKNTALAEMEASIADCKFLDAAQTKIALDFVRHMRGGLYRVAVEDARSLPPGLGSGGPRATFRRESFAKEIDRLREGALLDLGYPRFL